MRHYQQLSLDERVKLAQLRQSEASITEIALALGRNRSTVYRELKRNEAPPGAYWPDSAEQLARQRRLRGHRLDRDGALREFVTDHLCCHYWTPEQIAGWLRHRQTTLKTICHESLYAWIYHKKQRHDKLWKFLPRHKATRGLRKSKGAGVARIPDRISIDKRPKIVEKKKQFGHWEGDLMAFQKNTQHILVLRERKTMFTLSVPLPSKKARQTANALIDKLKTLPPSARKTLTLDNGGEFADHQSVFNSLGIRSYFCDPYASWQKGGIENTNGRLRRDLPRNTNIKTLPKEEFDEILQNYNLTPRKSLNWLTPLEAFSHNLPRVALQT